MDRTQIAAIGSLEFRPGRPADTEQIREFVSGLSARTRQLRFFASVGPSSGLLRALSGAGGADVVLALDRGRVIGHGMAADRTGFGGVRSSDVGLVVADGWQNRGVGTALLRVIVDRAAARGATMLVMDVLPSNDRMLGVIAHRWPGASRTDGVDCITIRADLTTGGVGATAA